MDGRRLPVSPKRSAIQHVCLESEERLQSECCLSTFRALVLSGGSGVAACVEGVLYVLINTDSSHVPRKTIRQDMATRQSCTRLLSAELPHACYSLLRKVVWPL